jgi:hypothetical protein
MNPSTEASLANAPSRLRLPLLPGKALAGFLIALIAVS